MALSRKFLLGALPLLGLSTAHAHLSYAGRDYGTFTSASLEGKTISNQIVEGNWGWADGTDSDWAYSHYQSYFKFVLSTPATISLRVSALGANFLPAFSIYQGLGTVSPPDQDEEGPTVDYLISLPGEPREGAYQALATWKMGNENDSGPADFSTFTYMAHAADGTPANYGNAQGILGDGVADGFVMGTFALPAGSYTVTIGGANYFDQEDGVFHPFTTTLQVVPEPSCAALLMSGVAGLGLLRRRSKSVN
jgi:hypothetical protein